MNHTGTLPGYRTIFRFWYPLASTWLMMAAEGPFLAAIIARLVDPKFNLAAFGVAAAMAMIIEAPIIMILSATNALVTNNDAFVKMKRFTYVLNGIVTAIQLFILIPPVFYFIAEDLIKLPPTIARLAHHSLILMIPWPAAIGYRRFYQGLLIRANLTHRVAYGTIVRLGTMATTAAVLYTIKIPGAYVGAAALSIGVVFEAAASRIMAIQTIKKIKTGSGPFSSSQQAINKDTSLTYPSIIRFYYPLALTSLLSLAIHPFVTFFIGRSRFPLESLAILPVINGLTFVFRSLALSYLEVVVALVGKDNEGYIPLRNFAWILGIGVVAGLSLFAFTPLALIWFNKVSGLSLELTGFSMIPIRIMALHPGLSVLLSFQQGILVNSRNTKLIPRATLIEVLMMIAVLFVSIYFLDFIGATAAACAYILGRTCANLYLFPHQMRAARRSSRF